MKNICLKMLSAVLTAAMLLCLFAACGKTADPTPSKPAVTYPRLLGEVKSNANYTENELYIWNSITERKIYCREVIPASYQEGTKIPMIVYIHGFNGDATSLITEPEALAVDGIAGFTIECCGGNKVTQKSDGKDIVQAHYSSRVTDLITALEYVLTLPYVDPEQVYIYGQSYGGTTTMMAAPLIKDKIAGLILESTGISKAGVPLKGNETKGELAEYTIPVEQWEEYVVQYEGDIILCHSEGDTMLPMEDNAVYTTEVYNRRANGTMTLYRCPEGEHAYNAFSEEGKAITLNAIREMVLGK